MDNTMKLYVGTDSTWSLRTLVCAGIAQVATDVEVFRLNDETSRNTLKKRSPTGLVPVLQEGDLVINDSLSIVEYLNEIKPGCIYPTDRAQRAISRSLCAEMHAGFLSLRQQMPFSTSGDVSTITPSSQAAADISRISAIFSSAKADFFWDDNPCAVDAFYSVMAYRLKSYGINFSGQAGRYQDALIEWKLFQQALKQIA